MDNLKSLKDKEKFRGLSITDDYTITERQLIKQWLQKAKENSSKEAPDVKHTCEVRSTTPPPPPIANDTMIANKDKTTFVKTGTESNSEGSPIGNKFNVDYSKRGMAKCKVCNKLIAKNELRIGKLVPFKVRSILRYFHVKCLFESLTKAKIVTNVIK